MSRYRQRASQEAKKIMCSMATHCSRSCDEVEDLSKAKQGALWSGKLYRMPMYWRNTRDGSIAIKLAKGVLETALLVICFYTLFPNSVSGSTGLTWKREYTSRNKKMVRSAKLIKWEYIIERRLRSCAKLHSISSFV